MRNGVTLATLRTEAMIEAGLSTEAGHSAFSKERLDQMLNRTERAMAQLHDWGSNQVEEQVTVAADAQFAALPANITFTMIDTVHVLFGDQWLPVTHGITAEERSIYDTAQRSVPIQRWEVQAPGNTQFEVWPIGGTAQTMLFEGAKTLGTMTADTDTCTLDADVLVMRVAAQILGRDRKEDAQLMLREAERLTVAILKRQGSAKRPPISQGLRAHNTYVPRPGIDYIAPGS